MNSSKNLPKLIQFLHLEKTHFPRIFSLLEKTTKTNCGKLINHGSGLRSRNLDPLPAPPVYTLTLGTPGPSTWPVTTGLDDWLASWWRVNHIPHPAFCLFTSFTSLPFLPMRFRIRAEGLRMYFTTRRWIIGYLWSMAGMEPRRNYRTLSYWLGSPFFPNLHILYYFYFFFFFFYYHVFGNVISFISMYISFIVCILEILFHLF